MEVPEWMMDSGQFLMNVPDDNDRLPPGQQIRDPVYLFIDDDKKAWLAVFPQGRYCGSTEIKEGEHISNIRRRIAKGDYESSKHDYWQGALRRMSTRACEGRANRNRLCHHREITEENHDILYRLLMSIRYPMAME